MRGKQWMGLGVVGLAVAGFVGVQGCQNAGVDPIEPRDADSVGIDAVVDVDVDNGTSSPDDVDADVDVDNGTSSPDDVDADVDVEAKRWRVVGTHTEASTGQVEIDLEIDGHRHRMLTRPIPSGREFELFDAGGERFGFSVDGENDRMSEWTNTDRLDVVVDELSGDRVRETYTLNGHERSWVVDANAGDKQRTKTVEEFRAFMPESNSLNQNALGEKLFSVLSDEAFVEDVEARDLGLGSVTGAPGFHRLPPELEKPCQILRACTLLKCTWYGGIANPMCRVCVIGSLLCLLVEIFG